MTLRLTSGALVALVSTFATLLVACGDDTEPNTTNSGASSSSGTGAAGGNGGAGGAGGTAGMGGAGGAGGTGGMAALPDLDPALVWYGQNREALDQMIDKVGQNGPSYDPAKKPVAIFDWDNTVIKNDIGDLVVFWQVKNDKILQPPKKDWRTTSAFLTGEAQNALSAACSNAAGEGQPLPTSSNAACADEILAVYTTGKTKAGAAAFAGWNWRTMEPAYAWAAQLQAGYTPAEVKSFAMAALEEGLAAAEGATQTLGTTAGLNAYVRVYDQIANLIGVMQANGIDTWVLSASSQPIVEAFAEKVNITADHVIGIRSVLDATGKLTYDFKGCGPVPDGSGNGSGMLTGNSMITYIEGKRCFMNQVIYGVSGPDALLPNPDPAKRPVFGAGDSDTDISFLQDATTLKLAINRNKSELMCNAYANYMGKWIINPMFIAPKGQLASGYPCATTACKNALGVAGPCMDEAGVLISDQKDTVF